MLTFEKVLEVFQAYLDDDPLYEVVQTSHGYTLMAWEPHRNDWYSAEIQKTPEDLRNALLGTYANFLEDKITGNERELTVTETREILSEIKPGQSVGIFIGPEGGFEEEEVAKALEAGAHAITLGRRILRTETAGLAILSVLMFQLENE